MRSRVQLSSVAEELPAIIFSIKINQGKRFPQVVKQNQLSNIKMSFDPNQEGFLGEKQWQSFSSRLQQDKADPKLSYCAIMNCRGDKAGVIMPLYSAYLSSQTAHVAKA